MRYEDEQAEPTGGATAAQQTALEEMIGTWLEKKDGIHSRKDAATALRILSSCALDLARYLDPIPEGS